MEGHGGQIWVESQLGQGSVFLFTIPVYMVEENGVQSVGVASNLENGLEIAEFDFHSYDYMSPSVLVKIKKILVVDDEANIRSMLRQKLEEAGFAVYEAENGQNGLNMVRTVSPDLILLDMIMPGLDGLQVLTTLKSDSAIKNIPVIVLTIADFDEKVISAGADSYLNKPVNFYKLLSEITLLLP